MEILLWLVDGFWDLIAASLGWRPDPVLKGQFEFVAAAFGIVGGGYTVYRISHRIVTGRSITDEDAGKVAGELLGTIDDKLEVLIEQRLKAMMQARFAENSSGTGASAPGAPSSGGGADSAGLLREAMAGVTALEREGAAAGHNALETFAKTGDLAPTREALAELAAKHEADRDKAGSEAAASYRQLGALAFLNDTDEALKAYRKAVELDPEDADGWNQLGRLLNRTGDLEGALKAYGKVLALGNRLTGAQAKKLQAVATGNLGNIYETRGDLDQAEDMQRKSLALNQELGRKEGMANTYTNLGAIYETRGDLDQAEDMQRKALALHQELGRKEGMANTYGNLGIIYKRRGDLAAACTAWQQARALFAEVGIKHMVEKVSGSLREAGCPEA